MPRDCLRVVLGQVLCAVLFSHQVLRCRARMCRHCGRPRPFAEHVDSPTNAQQVDSLEDAKHVVSLEDAKHVDSLTTRARRNQPSDAESTEKVIIFYKRWNDINLFCFTADGRRTPTSEQTCGSECGLLHVCVHLTCATDVC